MTDHTSPATYESGSIGVAEPSPSENGPESFRGEARYADYPEFETRLYHLRPHPQGNPHFVRVLTTRREEKP